MEKVLCVGLVCLDIINYCEYYPSEDEDIRAKDQKWCKGGNAANTASVLRLLDNKEQVEFLGTIGTGVESEFVMTQLNHYGVEHANCVHYEGYKLPTSCVVLSTVSGSRTIIHYRNLPELKYQDFAKIDLSCYSWIHFEGRNPEEVSQMVASIRKYNLDSHHHAITISIELEKRKEILKPLEILPDVLFISKEYAGFRGYQTPEQACLGIRNACRKGATVVCAWGERGATAIDQNGQLYSSPSFPPPGGLVDTLGAGDTFNGAVIHSLSKRDHVKDAIMFGCRVAGRKCGMDGFDGLYDINWNDL